MRPIGSFDPKLTTLHQRARRAFTYIYNEDLPCGRANGENADAVDASSKREHSRKQGGGEAGSFCRCATGTGVPSLMDGSLVAGRLLVCSSHRLRLVG